MNKYISFFTAAALIVAAAAIMSCKNGKDKDKDNDGRKAMRVILASELISKADAATLLGGSVTKEENTGRSFTDQMSYKTDKYDFNISLIQEALYDKNSSFEANLLKNGWASYMKEMENAYVSYPKSVINGGNAYLQPGIGFGGWLLHVFYGDYYILLYLANKAVLGPTPDDSPAEITWKQTKIKEAASLALDRLKEIIKK